MIAPVAPDRLPGVASRSDAAGETAVLTGDWTLAALAPRLSILRESLQAIHAHPNQRWDCRAIDTLDSAGAILLWQAWGRCLPAQIDLTPAQQHIFDCLAAADQAPPASKPATSPYPRLERFGQQVLIFRTHLIDFVALLGQFFLNLLYVCRTPAELPRHEIFANLYKAGVRALPVTALVGFLIGVVLSYLSSLQLRQFGAEVFIINILGLGVIRELGPMLVAVLVAGRSGSAMTAQLGVMRVTEEIDALATMGVMRSLRLVFPKVVALAIAMPLLVMWTIVAALLGGMVSAEAQLDISYGFFIETLPKVVPVINLWIALGKGLAFGAAIALVACHFGLRVRPNTESLSANTTASVVSAITVVILIDAVFAIATRKLGMP